MEYENFDLKNIVTPVNVDVYEKLLVDGYNKKKTKYLVNGFKRGFSFHYQGPKKVKKDSHNLKLNVGTPEELWNKVMTEVKTKRYAGPFEQIPFKYYIQSPIGLVPKDKGKKFNLSYPKNGESVNSGIPEDKCSVKYPDFMEAVAIVADAGQACYCAKSDMSMVACPYKISKCIKCLRFPLIYIQLEFRKKTKKRF